MDHLDNTFTYFAAFTAGITAHQFALRHGEWDLWTNRLVVSFALLHITGIAVLLRLPDNNTMTLRDAARIVGTLGLLLVSGILSSLLVYRGFFHRLNRFPGPFLARFSNFYVTGLSAKNLHLYEEVQLLHQQYGDIVRLGMTLRCQFLDFIANLPQVPQSYH
jgi:hypothetical protein